VALVERQLQLWTTPHGLIKAALANNATVQGRAIAFAVPGRYTVKATLDGNNLVEKSKRCCRIRWWATCRWRWSTPTIGLRRREVPDADPSVRRRLSPRWT
jgi:hypothetical protein